MANEILPPGVLNVICDQNDLGSELTSHPDIAKVLNHVEGGARANRVYDRHSYDGEKRNALDAWERALGAVLEESDTTTVLLFASTERSR